MRIEEATAHDDRGSLGLSFFHDSGIWGIVFIVDFHAACYVEELSEREKNGRSFFLLHFDAKRLYCQSCIDTWPFEDMQQSYDIYWPDTRIHTGFLDVF